MAKKRQKKSLEELVPDADLRQRMKDHLYSKRPVLEEGSVFSDLLQGLVNQMLDGEMDDFMDQERQSGRTNKRNGYQSKQVRSTAGKLQIETPRDRSGDFEPELIAKRQRDLSSGLDEQILALYAQGNSIEDVKRLLSRMYGISISTGKISAITDRVLPEIIEWRERPLKGFYAVIYLDAIFFKVRHEGRYQNQAFYTVYAVDAHGERDLLGLYMNESEGANRWGIVLQDLQRRGVEDVLLFCTDNLSGFSEAIHEVYPKSDVQKCIVHKVRQTTRFCDDKDVKAVRRDLRKTYTASSRQEAVAAMDAFEVSWGHKYNSIVDSWRKDWEELFAFMDYPLAMRRMVYTTNPVEALHRIIRKIIKGKAAWVSQTALLKQIYLSLIHNEKSWKRNAHGWKSIQRDLMQLYGERFNKHMTT